MSTVPTGIAGAVASTPYLQQQVGDRQRVEMDAKDSNFRAQMIAAEKQDGTVSAGGDDSRVDADGGGTGGQGRAFREAPQENLVAVDGPVDGNGISVDDKGQVHVDLEA